MESERRRKKHNIINNCTYCVFLRRSRTMVSVIEYTLSRQPWTRFSHIPRRHDRLSTQSTNQPIAKFAFFFFFHFHFICQLEIFNAKESNFLSQKRRKWNCILCFDHCLKSNWKWTKSEMWTNTLKKKICFLLRRKNFIWRWETRKKKWSQAANSKHIRWSNWDKLTNSLPDNEKYLSFSSLKK